MVERCRLIRAGCGAPTVRPRRRRLSRHLLIVPARRVVARAHKPHTPIGVQVESTATSFQQSKFETGRLSSQGQARTRLLTAGPTPGLVRLPSRSGVQAH